MNRSLVALVAFAASAWPAHADFIYTFQSRTVTATAYADFGQVVVTNTVIAPDFGPFNESLEAIAVSTTGQHSGTGRAHLESTLDPLRVFASGGWSGSRQGGPGGNGGGDSSFSVNFMLDVPSDFTLQVGALGQFLLITGPGGFNIDQSGSYAGTLLPGAYSAVAGASGTAGFPPSGDGFFFNLVIIPAPSAAAVFAPLAMLTLRRRRV